MNCYIAKIRLYGTYEVSGDTLDWRDPAHRSYTRKSSQDASVCIYAETKERAEVFAKAWQVPSRESGCQLDNIYEVKYLSIEMVEENCDAETEGYNPEYDEYEVLYVD